MTRKSRARHGMEPKSPVSTNRWRLQKNATQMPAGLRSSSAWLGGRVCHIIVQFTMHAPAGATSACAPGIAKGWFGLRSYGCAFRPEASGGFW